MSLDFLKAKELNCALLSVHQRRDYIQYVWKRGKIMHDRAGHPIFPNDKVFLFTISSLLFEIFKTGFGI